MDFIFWGGIIFRDFGNLDSEYGDSRKQGISGNLHLIISENFIFKYFGNHDLGILSYGLSKTTLHIKIPVFRDSRNLHNTWTLYFEGILFLRFRESWFRKLLITWWQRWGYRDFRNLHNTWTLYFEGILSLEISGILSF